MQTRLVAESVRSTKTQLLGLPALGKPWKDPAVAALDKALGGLLQKLAREEGFSGKEGQTLTATGTAKVGAERVVLVGLGAEPECAAFRVKGYAAQVGRIARSKGFSRFALVVPAIAGQEGRSVVRWLSEGARLGVYRFDLHKTGDRKAKKPPSSCTLVLPTDGKRGASSIEASWKSGLREGEIEAEGVCFARDLVNEPPNVLTPTVLAERAAEMAREVGLDATVLGPAEIHERGMRLLEAVNQGAKEPPRFVHLVHRPKKGSALGKVALVGKGITFDSGGLSLKPPKGQMDMKGDMGGAAVVLGTLRAAARLDLPYEIHGIVPTTENMPGGNATRPGDIVAGMNGKTVEILNTDAEGRLILADALAYAVELSPDVIIDHATLTGACMVALGQNRAGVWASDEPWADRYLAAAERTGESVWRLPLAQELKEGLKSDVADLRNIGNSWGGAITAALFLAEFVGKVPWIHVDIAGPSYLEKPHAFYPKGGTGFGIATLVELLRT